MYRRASGRRMSGELLRRVVRIHAAQVAVALLAASASDEATAQARPAEGPSVVVAAGERYRAGTVHRWILGPHHRDAWTRRIDVPVLSLAEEAGGLIPLRKGGSMQTRSLRLLGADGRQYTFRSVDKDPSAILDELLHGTVVDDIVQDGISAAHPFGALVAAPLLHAAGVLHVEPRLFVMPDDPALGEFRDEFAGMLGLLEERPDENEGGRTAFAGAEKVIGSEKLVERIDDGPDERVDARAYLRARLMDVFLGDWDRHRDQWRWATFDDEKPRRWVPIPRDRDQVFSNFDGIGPRVASLHVPQLVRFGPEYPDITRLLWNSRAIDRWFLAGLDRRAWDEVGASVQAALTDEVIEEAVRRLPREVGAVDGETLITTLKSRRTGLPSAWAEFYATISREVDLRATDTDETVTVDRSESGTVTVAIAAEDDEPYLKRRFVAGETEEVRIHLRDGDDKTVVTGDADPGILVRVVGGPGDDGYFFEGASDDIELYDHEGDDRVIGPKAPSIDARPFDEWEWSPEDRDEPLTWGRRTIPTFWSGYDADLGLFLGAGARLERYGFRAVPFASALELRAGLAPAVGRGRVELDGRWNRSNSPLFSTFQARLSGTDVLHYYGLGNATAPGDPSSHRVDVSRASVTAGLGVTPAPWFELRGRIEVERTRTRHDPDRFLSTLGPLYGNGAFSALGVGASLAFDPLAGNERTGSRFRLSLDGVVHPGVLDVEEPYGRIGGSVSALLASSPRPAVSLALRAGAQQVLGPFPWHDAAFLGGSGTIRGLSEQRLAGDAAVHAGAELRLRVLRATLLIPADVGVFGFTDSGRVFVDGASPGGWHTGVGGGLYLRPLTLAQMIRLGVATTPESTRVFMSMGLPY